MQSTFNVKQPLLYPDPNKWKVLNGCGMPEQSHPREAWQMEQNEEEHQKWVQQYNEMHNSNAGKKMTNALTLIADAAHRDSVNTRKLQELHAKEFGYDKPNVEPPPMRSNKRVPEAQKDVRFKSPPYIRVNPVSRMAFRRCLEDGRDPVELAKKTEIPLKRATHTVPLSKSMFMGKDGKPENWRLPYVTPRSRWPSQRRESKWTPDQLEAIYKEQRKKLRMSQGLPPHSAASTTSGPISAETLQVISTLTDRLDHLEREVEIRNAQLTGAPLPFTKTHGPAPEALSDGSLGGSRARTGDAAHGTRAKQRKGPQVGGKNHRSHTVLGTQKYALQREQRVNVGQEHVERHDNATLKHNKQHAKMNSKLDEARKAFDLIDTDKSGTITKDELKVALEKSRGEEVSMREINQIFNHLDTNKDGEISFKEFHTSKPLKGKYVAGVGWRYDAAVGGVFNPHAWAAGHTVDQKLGGKDKKIVDKMRTIGKQVNKGQYKRSAITGAADEPFVPSDATVASDLVACIKSCNNTSYEKWFTEKEKTMGSMYFPQGRLPECREHPENRGPTREWIDGQHKIKYVPTKSPMHSFSNFAGVCINQNVAFTESGGFYADGPRLNLVLNKKYGTWEAPRKG